MPITDRGGQSHAFDSTVIGENVWLNQVWGTGEVDDHKGNTLRTTNAEKTRADIMASCRREMKQWEQRSQKQLDYS